MFITVQLLAEKIQPLLYSIPPEWDAASLLGKVVHVPVRNRVTVGLIINTHKTLPCNHKYTIKQALHLESMPPDPLYEKFIEKIAHYYHIERKVLIARLHHFFIKKQEKTTPFAKNQENCTPQEKSNIILTPEQQRVCDFLCPAIVQRSYTPTLLQGITGSGKTEVYKALITATHASKQTSLLLLPEIGLAKEFKKILQNSIGVSLPIYSIYSGISPHEKQQLWHALNAQQPCLIIGVHLPIMLPIARLGLIIVDEEHETGYQEKKHPKINTKEAALIRAQLYSIPILLGSATPSISSLYNVYHRNWHLFQLTKRFSGDLPTIIVEPLTLHQKRPHFWISHALYKALVHCLNNKEQAIIFINRRGMHFFMQCKECGFIFSCASCSVSLTLHDADRLQCHYCGYKKAVPASCTSCYKTNFIKRGIGTQHLVHILTSLFPLARVGRVDLDVTSKKKVWEKTISDFSDRSLDILVGTQSIAKGFHFPHVTLVGIIWADLNLHFPHYSANERVLQQLIQVAGRAGRQSKKSSVIVQILRQHPIFSYLSENDYINFYKEEIKNRHAAGYPPYKRLVEIELKHNNEGVLTQESSQLTEELIAYREKHGHAVHILGPTKPVTHTIKKIHRRTIYLKGDSIAILNFFAQSITHHSYKSSIFWTPNPIN